MHHCVYFLHSIEGAPLYVGRSNKPSIRLREFINRTGIEAKIVGLQRFTNLDDACAAELTAIKTGKHPHNRHIVSARTGTIGRKRTPEERARISASKLGHTVSAATRAKLAIKCSGWQHSAQARSAISSSLVAQHASGARA